MRAVTAIRLVAMREIRERVRSRFFLIVVGITALAVAAVVIVPPKLLDGNDEPPVYKIGLVGESTFALEQALSAAAKASAASVDLQRITDIEDAETGILDGDLDAALVDGEELVIGPDTGRVLQGFAALSKPLGATHRSYWCALSCPCVPAALANRISRPRSQAFRPLATPVSP